MPRTYQIIRALRHPLHLSPLRDSQPHRRLQSLRLYFFAHVFAYNSHRTGKTNRYSRENLKSHRLSGQALR